MSPGQAVRASHSAMPVFTPARLASSDFARMIPWRSSTEPQTATGFPRREWSSMASTE